VKHRSLETLLALVFVALCLKEFLLFFTSTITIFMESILLIVFPSAVGFKRFYKEKYNRNVSDLAKSSQSCRLKPKEKPSNKQI
jgi:hypothetical protein